MHRRRLFITGLVLWLAFGLRLYQLDFQSIWWDEGHSLFVASHPIAAIPTLPAMDVHPPAYFALLHGWMNLTGSSEFALRYLSVIFSLLTIAVLWRFAANISHRLTLFSPPLSGSPASLTALLAALSPLYVAYAQEVRSYAMLTFLALTSTYLLWRILFTNPQLPISNLQSPVIGNWLLVISYILLSAAGLYTHYFTIFLLLFHNLAWLVWLLPAPRRRGKLWRWIVSQAGILFLFTPQLWLALHQVTGYTNPNLTPPGLGQFISRSWQAYTVGLTLDPTLAWWGMMLIAAGLIASWVSVLFSTASGARYQVSGVKSPAAGVQSEARQTQVSSKISSHSLLLTPYFLFLASWFLLPLAAYFLVLQRQPSFEPRYMMLVTPALFLLLALGISQVSGVRSPAKGAQSEARKAQASRFRAEDSLVTFYVLRFTFYAIPLLVFAVSLHSYYTDETYFKDDSAGVARWLAQETGPNDLIYVDVPHPFHYYAAKGRIAAPLRYLFVDIHTAADTLSREAAGRSRLFWITWRGSDTDPRGVIPFLAQKYGQKLGQRDFRGYHVEWFSLPPAGTTFSLPTDLPPLSATFGETVRLDGAAYGQSTISPGQTAWATLHFSLLRPTDIDYKVSLRLRDEAGHVAAQTDRDLLNDRHFRTSAWPPDDPALNQAVNVYTLPLAADAPPGPYRLEVVVYNSQPPYPSEGVSGPARTPDGNAAIIGNLVVKP